MNLASIKRAITAHASTRATDLLLFPECAISGYNTGLQTINFEMLHASVVKVRELARHHSMFIALPTPWPSNEGQIFNSVLMIDSEGEIAKRFDKIGLHRGEERLFIRGAPHSRSLEILGHRIGVVICIEASHDPWSYLDQKDSTDVILWPGFYGMPPLHSWADSQEKDDLKMRENFREWRAPVIQAFCSSSPEAQKWPDRTSGDSLVLDQNGRQVFRADHDREQNFVIMMNGSKIRHVK